MTEQSPYSERRGGQALTTPRQRPSPGPQEEQSIAALIARMMLHFWTPQELSDGARKAMAADWIADLREFGPDIVSRACGEWRRTQSKRPTIADIRKLCFEERQLQREREDLPTLPPPEAVAEYRKRMEARQEVMRREGRDLSNAWARRMGYADFDAYLADGGTFAKAIAGMMPETVAATFPSTAAALGVTAREWTPDQMAEGRKQVGLEG